MDVLGQVLHSLVGDHPPNGWTALIALGVCVAYVASQFIRAWHHAEQRRFITTASKPQLDAIIATHADDDEPTEPPDSRPPAPPKPMKAPGPGSLVGVLLVLFGVGVAVRFSEGKTEQVAAVGPGTETGSGSDKGRGRKAPAGRPCVPACSAGQYCSDGTCVANARKPAPTKSGPHCGPDYYDFASSSTKTRGPDSLADLPAWVDSTPDRPGDALLTARAAELALWAPL